MIDSIKTVPRTIVRQVRRLPARPAFEFFVLIALYLSVCFYLLQAKRDPSEAQRQILAAVSALTALALTVSFCCQPLPDRKQKIAWLKDFFSLQRGEKAIHVLCRISLLCGAIGLLFYAFRLNGWFYSPLFAVQVALSILIYGSVLLAYNVHQMIFTSDWLKWFVGLSFTLGFLALGFYSRVYSGEMVTSALGILPDQIPSISAAVYYYVFFISISYLIMMTAIFLSSIDEISRALYATILLCVSSASVTIVCALVLNGPSAINWLIFRTYQADMLPFFICQGKEQIATEYNNSARYLKIGDGLYRILAVEKGNIIRDSLSCSETGYQLKNKLKSEQH
jgi:hypothetical protein